MGRRIGADADVAAAESVEHDVAPGSGVDDREVRAAGRAVADPRPLDVGVVAVADIAGLLRGSVGILECKGGSDGGDVHTVRGGKGADADFARVVHEDRVYGAAVSGV